MARSSTGGHIDDGYSSQRGEDNADEAREDAKEQEARTTVPGTVPAIAGPTTQTTPKSQAGFNKTQRPETSGCQH